LSYSTDLFAINITNMVLTILLDKSEITKHTGRIIYAPKINKP
jgi:hypothetical protein